MKKDMTPAQLAERSIIKKYRKELWAPFVTAIRMYGLIQPGDRIAVCISGGKDSMLMAKLFQMLEKITEIPFETTYLVMDPGYKAENRRLIEQNAETLAIPIQIAESPIFAIAEKQTKNPCYLCAKMRRGYLYRFAKEAGCNKIALGHHRDDVIVTTVMAMFYASQLQGMMPRIRSKNFPGMELIRPMYRIFEEDIIAWKRYNGLEFLQCACALTERAELDESESKRQEVKSLIKTLKKTNPDIEKSLFNAIHTVETDTFPGWKERGTIHSFLEKWDQTEDDRVQLSAAGNEADRSSQEADS